MVEGCVQVRGYIYDVVPAGGHQIYAYCGSTLIQARPLNVALYGLPHEQARFTPVISFTSTFTFNSYSTWLVVWRSC